MRAYSSACVHSISLTEEVVRILIMKFRCSFVTRCTSQLGASQSCCNSNVFSIRGKEQKFHVNVTVNMTTKYSVLVNYKKLSYRTETARRAVS